MTDTLTTADILGPDGRIASRLKNYEHRPQQLEMSEAVAAALTNNQHLVAEAGTGVGKSFAYLVPAILHATAQEPDDAQEGHGRAGHGDADQAGADQARRRIIISTHTISLQEQLLGKDLPFLNAVIPREFTAVLVKGRRNYISKRRLALARSRAGSLFHDQDDVDQLATIAGWANATSGGSLSDLDFKPNLNVWDEVASDSGNCMGRNCGDFKTCFYYKSRRRVKHAQILIVNHALFFSDLALRKVGVSILPDYHSVIFDEAHTIADVAGAHMGLSVTSGQLDFTLSRLYNDRTQKGLLVHYKLKKAQQLVDDCRTLAKDFFDEIDFWHSQNSGGNGRVRQRNIVSGQIIDPLTELAEQVSTDGRKIQDPAQRQDFGSASDRLLAIAGQINQWLEQKLDDSVFWIETSQTKRGHTRVTLKAAPVDIGPVLHEDLFSQIPSVVMTSATLAVGKPPRFDFFKSRVGMTQCQALQVGSPFDYRRQARLVLPQGMPDPTREKDEYERMCTAMIRRYVAQTDGHAFVLFTSYSMLRNVARQLMPWLREQNLAMYNQADGVPRNRMLEQFKQNSRAVLLGTDSFWQGVDVPGDALQNVIITKLPFSVPDQPLLSAHLDSIRAAGGNPFNDYQLPEAIIKLRQGFGRLIRSQQDHGMVVILDPRIQTKPYGRKFIESLPECEIVQEVAVAE